MALIAIVDGLFWKVRHIVTFKTLRSPHTKKTYISALTTLIKYKKFTNANQLLLEETKLTQSSIIECILYLKETTFIASKQ
jgi:hypothetical protein